MKVRTLEGTDLDYWVGKAECIEHMYIYGNCLFAQIPGPSGMNSFRPSRDWSQGGPVIEREGISLQRQFSTSEWSARRFYDDQELIPVYGYGETPLLAAMRCYVTSKFGDEVESATQHAEAVTK